MMTNRKSNKQRLGLSGFTLVEILVVLVIFGIAATGMFSVYLTMQKTSSVQEKVVDLQQNIRIAVDALSRDIRMAGFLIPADTTSVVDGSNASTLIVRTASPFYAVARLAEDHDFSSGITTPMDFNVAQQEMVDPFVTNEHIVRVIRPMDGSQPINNNFTVTGKTRQDDPPNPANLAGFPYPILTLTPVAATPQAAHFIPGDMIVRVSPTSSDPPEITWSLVGSELKRDMEAGDETVVDQIETLTFSYLLKDGSEIDVPLASDLENINAVRVTIVAKADNAQADGVSRERSLSTVVRIRN